MISCLTQGISEKAVVYKPVEKSLYKTWLFQQFSQKHLTTTDGRPLSILDPGQRNELEGPDFKNARILINGEILSGDVEIHVVNEDWYHHKHHQDVVYNNVILHVVLNKSESEKIYTQAGKSVPIFVVFPETVDEPTAHLCEHWTSIDETHLDQVLEKYADIRFNRKGIHIRTDLLKTSANQSFYRQFLDILGYSRNRAAFRNLADLLPVSTIYSIIEKTEAADRIITLESILLGTAGFIEEQDNKYCRLQSRYFQGIYKTWEQKKQPFHLSSNRLDWHFAGIRPWNFPHRRIIALAQILAKIYPDDPAQLLFNQISLSRSFQSFLHWVRELFQQPGGMWKNHPLLVNYPGNVLIGSGRLMDLITNLFLPFCRAIASLENNSGLINKVIDYYPKIPKGEIPSVVKKWALGLKLPVKYFQKNYLIQGAIELNHSFCDLDLCKLCPLEEYAS